MNSNTVIIIPTYNNASVIKEVVLDVQKIAPEQHIIVVNDGSTDGTKSIISEINDITVIDLKQNSGKGIALKNGFEKAFELGAHNAITFDGDGQHLAVDLPKFIQKIEENPKAIYIGNRTLEFEGGVEPPSRSTTGRKIGNFWFKFITAKKLNDTQCGFRAYPLKKVLQFKVNRKKYEYEQELMIRLVWSGVDIVEVPIHLYYQPKGESMSHFRPFRDFLHITRVNSRFAFIRVINPVVVLDVPGNSAKEKLVSLVKHELRANTTPKKAAASIAVGIFFGLSPFHLFQVLLTIAASFVFKLNKPLSFLGVNISPPPLLPFIIAAEAGVGKLLIPVNFYPAVFPDYSEKKIAIIYGGTIFIVGSLVFATISALLAFYIIAPIVERIQNNRKQKTV